MWDRNGRIMPVWISAEPDLLTKAEPGFGQMSSDSEGAYRWITVHPWGDDEKGIPVKIRESKTERGVWHVVGGAGGRLNYLKLTNIKSPEEYKKRQVEKKRLHKEAEKGRREVEKVKLKQMTPEEREESSAAKRRERERRGELETHLETQRREMIADVAKNLGWKDDEWKFDATRERLSAAGASEERIAQLEQSHYKRVFGRAQDAVRLTKRQVLLDADLRAAAGLNDLPLTSVSEDVIALADLDPDRLERGLGYRRDITKMSDAEVQGELALEDVERLKGELTAAQNLYNAEQPVTAGRVERLKQELRTADLIVRAASGEDPEGWVKRDAELKKDLQETRAELATVRKQLPKDRDESDPHVEALLMQEGALSARVTALNDWRDDIAVLLGSGVLVVKGEKGEMQAKRQQEREAEITAQGGDVGAYREFLDHSKKALEGYRAEIQSYRAAGVLTKPDLPVAATQNPEAVIGLLKRAKALEQLERQTREQLKDEEAPIDERLFGKGYWVETRSAKLQESVKRELENTLAEQATKTFLREVESTYDDTLIAMAEQEKRENLQRHLSAGSYNALNHAGWVIQKAPTLSRDAVDVLGSAASAQVMAWGIRQGRSPEDLKAIQEGLSDYHFKNHMEASAEAVKTAEDLLQQAREIEIGGSQTPADLQRAQEMNGRRRDYLLQAREMLGQTLGELESTAALELALREGARKEVHVTLGPINAEAAIRQVRAIGLGREDYSLDFDGTNRFLTVKESGYSKLLKPVNLEEVKQAEEIDAIKRGDRDEEGWVPPGLIVRPSSSFTDPNLSAPKIAGHQQLQRPPGAWGTENRTVQQDVEDHIAARIADGEDPNDVLPDLLAHVNQVPEAGRKGVVEWLQKEMPLSVPATSEEGKPVYRFDRATGEVLKDAEGNPVQAMRQVKADFYRDKLNALAERYVKDRYGSTGKVAAFHAQGLRTGTPEESQRTSEAMYRALVEDPRAMVAWKDPGELSNQDQGALRNYFLTNVAKLDPKTGAHTALAEKRIQELGAEPQKIVKGMGLFGAQEDVAPEWSDWNNRKNMILAETQEAGSAWEEYIASHGGSVRSAYCAIQDRLKHDFVGRFSKTYQQQHGEPLKVGKQGIRYAERHLGFVDPATREKMLTEKRKLVDTLRTRQTGKYATGSVVDRVDGALREEEILRQNQVGMFAGAPAAAKLTDGERLALGERAENQIKSLMENVGRNFRGHTDQPIKLFKDFSMSGEATIGGAKVNLMKQQRAVKAFLTRKRLGAYLGTGSGKTAVMLGGFTAAASDPKSGVKRGIFLVPSQVQGQMHGEMARFVDPSKFHWSAQPGQTFEQRMAEHTDATTNMVVMTHEGFRDDMMKLLGDSGIDQAKFEAMPRKERAAALKAVWGKSGIDYQAAFVDEGHRAKKRRGQEESLVSKLFMAATDSTPYMMTSTADPLVNDVSEIRDQLDRLEPDERYGDEQEWHKRYGLNTTASRDALRHEVSSRFLMSSVSPPTKANRIEERVPLAPEQRKQYDTVVKMYEKARGDRAKGKINVEAIRALAPDHFEGVPAAEHENVARKLSDTLGLLREAALRRAINNAPPESNAKMQALEKRLKGVDTKSKPVLIFSHNPSVVKQIAERLGAQGHRTVTLSGSETAKEKDAARIAFQGGAGKEPTADIIVLSDAGATGLNLQRGTQVIQYDTPQTAMLHAQRQARSYRLGQQGDVDLVDLITDTPFEERARQMIATKYARRAIFSEANQDGEDELENAIQQRRAQRQSLEETKSARMVA